MNPNTKTNSKGLKSKRTKGPAPTPAGEKNSGVNTDLPFVKPVKDTNDEKEIVSIKMCIDDTISKG